MPVIRRVKPAKFLACRSATSDGEMSRSVRPSSTDAVAASFAVIVSEMRLEDARPSAPRTPGNWPRPGAKRLATDNRAPKGGVVRRLQFGPRISHLVRLCALDRSIFVTAARIQRYRPTARFVQIRYLSRSPNRWRGTCAAHTALDLSHANHRGSSSTARRQLETMASTIKERARRPRVVNVTRVASIAASLALERATQGAPMSKRSTRAACSAVSRLAITCSRLELAC
jgi:hypothetical protein